jgi:streptogramin lyase
MPQLTIKYTINLSPAFTFNTGTNTFNTGISGGFNVLNVVNNVVNNVAIDSNNNCYIATTNCIVRVDAVNNIVYPYNVTSSIQNISLKGITIDMNNDIYVTDSGNNQVIKLYSATNYNSFIVSPQSLSLNNPAGIAVDKTGQVCVCDSLNNRVILLSMQDLTEITDYMGQYLYNVSNITVDNNNNHIVNSFVGSVNYDPNFNFISNVSFPQSDSFITAAIAVDNNGTIIIIAPTSAGNGVFTESQLESIEAIYGTSISVILGNT